MYNVFDADGERYLPDHDYEGEHIHTAKVKNFDKFDTKLRMLTTSHVKIKDGYMIILYYNGKLITKKRIYQEKPYLYESYKSLDAICMEFQFRERD